MLARLGEWLLAGGWIFLGDPAAGEIRAWSGRAALAPVVIEQLQGLRALGFDRERGLWIAHGAGGEELVRGTLAFGFPAPRLYALQRVVLPGPVRALAPLEDAGCVAWLESGELVRVRAAAQGLLLEERAAWPALGALASDGRAAVLAAREDGALFLLEAERLAFPAARGVAPSGVAIERITWCAARGHWLVIESGGGTLRCLAASGEEVLRVPLPFPASAAAGSRSRLWVASSSENFVASLALCATPLAWRAEEVPPGDLRELFVRGGRVAAVGSTRFAWRTRHAWLARAGGPGLLAVERSR